MVDEHGRQFLHEERVAFGRIGDSTSYVVVERRCAEKVREHALRALIAQWCDLQLGRVLSFPPGRTQLEQLGSRHAEQ